MVDAWLSFVVSRSMVIDRLAYSPLYHVTLKLSFLLWIRCEVAQLQYSRFSLFFYYEQSIKQRVKLVTVLIPIREFVLRMRPEHLFYLLIALTHFWIMLLFYSLLHDFFIKLHFFISLKTKRKLRKRLMLQMLQCLHKKENLRVW